MVSAEQRAIEIVGSIDITNPLGYLLEHTLMFTFCSTELVVRLRSPRRSTTVYTQLWLNLFKFRDLLKHD